MTNGRAQLVERGGFALALTLMCAPAPAAAHARWFIDDSRITAAAFAFDGVYAAILAGATLFVMGAILLEVVAARSPRMRTLLFARLPVPFDFDWRVLSSSLGAVLIATSFTQMVLAPNLKADSSTMTLVVLTTAQAFAGALFLAQTRLRLAAVLITLLPLAACLAFSPLKVIDYAFEFAGLGLAFWVVAPELERTLKPQARPSRIKKPRPFSPKALAAAFARAFEAAARRDGALGIEAASLLRVMLGIQLIILAAHDKIFEPGVTLAFVEKYPFVNVPALLGVPGFTDLHFVFGAGMAEIVFGLLLVTNTSARLVAFMLTGLFTLTGLIFGLHEMLGHMPILFSLAVLVTQGGEQDSALAPRSGRTSTALGTALATILLGIIGISFEPKTVEARISAVTLAPATERASALSVPEALYGRFASLAHPASLEGDTIREANLAVKTMLATSKGDTRADKNDLAAKLADLAIRYEMAHGADAASAWLRYAVLTAACSPSELATFQTRVKAADWQHVVERAPAALRALLLPLAEKAALNIMKQDRFESGIPWAQISERAPTEGAGYVDTHTLACIVRILSAAGSAPQVRIETTSLDR